MQANFKPCPYRLVDDDGVILCNQIKSGDRQVTAATCHACPVAEIDCVHLRAFLTSQHSAPITVRWGNGKTQVWADPAPPLGLERAACAVKTIPILSPRDCTGCALREALVPSDAIHIMTKRAMARKPEPKLYAQARTNIVAQKIVRIQEWLAQKSAPRADEEPGILPLTFGTRSARSAGEERRVGWTD